MAYSFRGNPDQERIPIQESLAAPKQVQDPLKSTCSSEKVGPADSAKGKETSSNPFMDSPIIQREEEVKVSPEIASFPMMAAGKPPGKEVKRQPILASPNFMLIKKNLNKRASVQGRSALSRFAVDSAKQGSDGEEEHPPTLTMESATKPINLESATKPINLECNSGNAAFTPKMIAYHEKSDENEKIGSKKDILAYGSPRKVNA